MYWTIHLGGGPKKVNHAAACVEDKIFSFGGYFTGGDFKDWDPIPVYVLITPTLKWKEIQYTYAEKTGVPYQRYGHTVVAYKNKVYMWGGRNNMSAFDKLFCFDCDKLEWSSPPVFGNVPFPKDGHSACQIGNKMFIFGGFEDASDQYTSDVHWLNLDTLEWMRLHVRGTAPLNRDFHSAVAIGTRMYIFGGRSDGVDFYSRKEEYHSGVHYLDTETCEWVSLLTTGDLPTGRRSHSAWEYKSDMYIFGGYNGNTRTHYNDLYRLCPRLAEWKQLNIQGKIPRERRRQVCLMLDSKLYLFGGTSRNRSNIEPQDNNYEDESEQLVDNSDLHILDFEPSLRTLCINAVVNNNLDKSLLPREIKNDIRIMTESVD